MAFVGLSILLLAGAGGAYYWIYMRETVESLERDLDSPDARVRRRAAERLGKLGPRAQNAVEKLITRFADEDAAVRVTVKVALHQIGPPREASVLLDCLANDNSDARYYAAEMLADKVTDVPSTVLEHLKEAFEDKRNKRNADNARIRPKIVEALVKFGDQDTNLVLRIILDKALHDFDPDVAKRARDGLKKYAIRAIRHPDPDVQEAAFKEIATFKDRNVRLRAFLEALGYLNLAKRASEEIKGLNVNAKQDFTVLKDYLRAEKPLEVRRWAIRLAATPDVPDRALVLRALLASLGDVRIRREALEGLQALKLDAKQDLPILKEFIHDESVEVRARVLTELAKPDVPEHGWVVGVLLDARLKEPREDRTIRSLALSALEKLLDGEKDWEIIRARSLTVQRDEEVRRLAVYKLAEVGLTAERASVLGKVLKDTEERPEIRRIALSAFTRASARPEMDQMVRPFLDHALRDPDMALAGSALEALRNLVPPAPRAIEATDLRGRPPVQLYTAYSAGRLGLKAETIPILLDALDFGEKDDPQAAKARAAKVREAALEGLKDLLDGDGKCALIEKLHLPDRKHADVRLALVRALGKANPSDKTMQTILIEDLKCDSAAAVRKEALAVLKHCRLNLDVIDIPRLLKSNVPEVRVFAADAVLRHRPKTKEAQDALKVLLDSGRGSDFGIVSRKPFAASLLVDTSAPRLPQFFGGS